MDTVLVSYVLLIIVQTYFANVCYETDSWFLAPFQRYLDRNPDKAANVVANLTPQVAPFPGIEPTTKLWLMIGPGVAIHHFIAASITFVGYWVSSPAVFRVGISFEIGEDVLQYGQMLYSLIFTPGIGPFEWLPKVGWVFPVLHHALGLFAGTYAYFYLADWEEVQLLTFLLLAAALPGAFNKPLEVVADLSKPSVYGKINVFLQALALVIVLYSRFYIYFPLAFALFSRVHEEIGATAANVLAVPLLIFAAFNVLSLVMGCIGLVGVCKAQTFAEAVDALRKSNSGFLIGAGPVPHEDIRRTFSYKASDRPLLASA